MSMAGISPPPAPPVTIVRLKVMTWPAPPPAATPGGGGGGGGGGMPPAGLVTCAEIVYCPGATPVYLKRPSGPTDARCNGIDSMSKFAAAEPEVFGTIRICTA
jgi:hypothetical protein